MNSAGSDPLRVSSSGAVSKDDWKLVDGRRVKEKRHAMRGKDRHLTGISSLLLIVASSGNKSTGSFVCRFARRSSETHTDVILSIHPYRLVSSSPTMTQLHADFDITAEEQLLGEQLLNDIRSVSSMNAFLFNHLRHLLLPPGTSCPYRCTPRSTRPSL
jgi:hypothetical protein